MIIIVYAKSARDDMNEILTKTIKYRCFGQKNRDPRNDEYSQTEFSDYVEYNILGQCSIDNSDYQPNNEGILTNSILNCALKYKYDTDANGKEIYPVLIPKKQDMIYYIGQWFIINTCTPLTHEDEGILGWDIRANQSGETKYELDKEYC